MSLGCGKCDKRESCDTICDKIEEELTGLDLAALREPLAFMAETPDYAIRHSQGDGKIGTVHEETHRAIGSGIDLLCRIRKRDAMIFFGRVYLGVSVDQLCKDFNLKRSMIHACLNRAKTDLGRVQADEAVS